MFPDEVRNEADDNWGEPVDFSIEEMLHMPVMGEVQTELPLTNMDCVGQNDLCKVVTNNSEAPTQDTIPSKLDDMNFNESHCAKLHDESFCVTEKDLDCIDIDDLYR